MIAFLLMLTVVLVGGGVVYRHISNNPTSSKALRDKHRAAKGKAPRVPKGVKAKTRAEAATRNPSASRPAVHPARRLASGTVSTVRLVKTYVLSRKDKRDANALIAHEAAKAKGQTAATRPMDRIADRRGLKGAWEDLVEQLRGPSAPEAAELPTDVPLEVTPEQPTEQQPTQTPTPDATVAPVKTEEIHVPTYMTLFETGDALEATPFEGVFQIEQFIKALHDGTTGTANMYYALAERMAGPMNVDSIVVEPVQMCGNHQRAVAAAVGDADVNLSAILSATTEQLLERGIRVPNHHLINNEASVLGAALVPQFFEVVRTLAGKSFGDIREVHCLLKALREASDRQASTYHRIANKLADDGIDASVVEHFRLATRHQNGISMALGDADTNMTRLLTMTVRELAASSVKAPNANLVGV